MDAKEKRGPSFTDPTDDSERDDLYTRFTYHTPKSGQPEKYEQLREMALELALVIHESCPRSRERSLAFTKLEEAVMHANAAIARRS